MGQASVRPESRGGLGFGLDLGLGAVLLLGVLGLLLGRSRRGRSSFWLLGKKLFRHLGAVGITLGVRKDDDAAEPQ